MSDATTIPNPTSQDFFADLADRVIAKLDIGTGWRMVALIEQVVNETQANLTQLQTDSKRNEAEVKAREGEVAALREVIRALKEHQHRLGPCKSRQDLVNCMIDWATQQLSENQNKRTQLEAQSPKDEQAIRACQWEIETLRQSIRVLEQFSRTLDPYENKEHKNWKNLVKKVIRWAKKEVRDSEKKLRKLRGASPRNDQEISACEGKIAGHKESIQALEKHQNNFLACLNAYVQDQERNPQDFVTLLTRALEENREATKQLRRVTMPWSRPVFVSNKALAREVSVRLQAESVDKSGRLKKTLSAFFPKHSDVSKALHAYVNARSEVRQTLATGFKQCLGLAPKIWIGMKWPLPFGLVLYKELTELDRLRRERREVAHKCLDALVSQDNEEAREARKCLHNRLRQYLVEDAKCGKPDNDARAQGRKNAVQALENYINNPQDDTKRALDAAKDMLIEMATEHSFKKVQLSGDGPFNVAGKGELVGLTLSGGGIRSATFNLGVLQALARSKILRHVDYLSTVSGGGYIGSWLVGWIKRASFCDVEKGLDPDWKQHDHKATPEIEFLRDYSNYLTPHVGFLTADTWTAIVTFFRNLLLHLAILVSAGVGVLLIPHLLTYAAGYSGGGWWMVGVSQALLALAFVMFCYHFRQAAVTAPSAGWWSATPGRILLSICPFWLAGVYLEVCCFNANPRVSAWALHLAATWASPAVWALGLCVGFWFLCGIILSFAALSGHDPNPRIPAMLSFVLSVFSYLVLCFFCAGWALASLARAWPLKGFAMATFGVPLVMLVYLLAAVLQVGLTGLLMKNEAREWTARLGAWVLLISMVWAALFSIAIYGPFVALRLGAWFKGLTVAWAAHTASGVWSAFSSRSGNKSSTNWTDVLAVTAAPVFSAGLLILLSFGIYQLGVRQPATPPVPAYSGPVQMTLKAASSVGSANITLSGAPQENTKTSLADYAAKVQNGRLWERKWWLVLIALGFFVLAFLLSLRVDINEFAMNTFYRNRLVRCYLGASRPPDRTTQDDPNYECRRQQNPFSGFDPKDDLLLKSLRTDADPQKCEERYVGPYPIINAALNLTHGRRLAWQERKAESFTFTPLFCGGTISDQDSYLPTCKYAYPPEGVYLGTAMAISGAAVSPLVGFHYSAGAGFLMTVFNARLGQWLANPKYTGLSLLARVYRLARKLLGTPGGQPSPNSESTRLWNRYGPRLGLCWLVKELFGLTDDEAPYVYLSDGGQFENLGIYELVRRRCKLIVACDVSEDREYKFEFLGNAIRKCRDDFGVDISINVDNLRAEGKSKQNGDDDAKKSKQHCAVGIISYDKARAGDMPGILIYVKASLTGDEPADVLEYKNSHADFPHDSTADQWFSESQFESYRKLGQHIIEQCAIMEHGERQKTAMLDLLEMDQWNARTTSESLEDYLIQKLGGVYQPRKATNPVDGV
jgi:hypothetical protein